VLAVEISVRCTTRREMRSQSWARPVLATIIQASGLTKGVQADPRFLLWTADSLRRSAAVCCAIPVAGGRCSVFAKLEADAL
jgi:hypothetical protein